MKRSWMLALAVVLATPAYAHDSRCLLDVDRNGDADALSDGIILWRYLSGIRGPAMVANSLSLDAGRRNPTAIARNLDGCPNMLDPDEDGEREAATDGRMFITYLFEAPPEINADSDCMRCTNEALDAFLDAFAEP